MKLLICIKCHDVFNLDYTLKKCSCGETKGKYIDNLNAIYDGEFAIPLGFSNSSFSQALVNIPKEGLGKLFDAFVIPKNCKTFIKTNITEDKI